MSTTIYHSSSQTRVSADFKTIPYSNASIEFNSDKGSTASFNSPDKLREGDRIRIVGDNHWPFGGQVIKVGSKLRDGSYHYDCIDYTRLFFGENYTTWSGGTSAEIIRTVISNHDLAGNDLSGIENTKKVHGQLIWKGVTRWDIIQELRWLDYEAGQHIECYVTEDGTLIYRPLAQTHEGYVFKSAYDYNQEYDASTIMTGAYVYTEGETSLNIVASVRDEDLIAIWGHLFAFEKGC